MRTHSLGEALGPLLGEDVLPPRLPRGRRGGLGVHALRHKDGGQRGLRAVHRDLSEVGQDLPTAVLAVSARRK